jgi:CO dehydrogenase/acetyl-CoA synthase beta subunit
MADDYDGMLKSQLQRLARARGLDDSGRVDELRERLRAWDDDQEVDEYEKEEEEEEEEEEQEEKPKKPRGKKPSGKKPKFKIGANVKFKDAKGKSVKGVIMAIDGDEAMIEDAKEQEWQVDMGELEAA